MQIENVMLKHSLTDGEMAALARSQAQSFGRVKALEDELNAVKKDYAGRIALAQAEVSGISSRVNTGFEMRDIRCLLLDERPEGYRLVVRLDNGHIARRRHLNPEERQLKLDMDATKIGQGFTATPSKDLCFSALLPVDEESWDVDVFQVGLYQDEADELKSIPGVELVPIIRHKLLGDGKPEAKDKKGKK
jgi:hypothetical protein